MRRDRVGSSSSSLFRVYLDNFDLLERHSQAQAELIYRGTVSEGAFKAEIQGAIVDGVQGFAIGLRPCPAAAVHP